MQLGRLRQWAGEVMSREKPAVNEEFQELERDIELRKDGMQRMLLASEAYHHALAKKKANEALVEADKFLPIDILGIVMIVHGEEFGDDSLFGRSLVKYGRAHCKIATLQEAYALTFKDTFIESINRAKEQIKEYELLKKKLGERRSAFDAASARYEKVMASKKDKDKREAEDEMERTRQRYEETAEDIRAHMHAIQENELNQHRELTAFLDLETNFVESYLEVLRDVRSEWQERVDGLPASSTRKTTAPHPSPFHRTPSKRQTNGHVTPSRPRAGSTVSSDDSSEVEDNQGTASRLSFSKHRKGTSISSRPPSRPASRLSRKRTNSTATSDPKDEVAKGDEAEEEKKQEKTRRLSLSVSGWASNAVESVTGGRNKKSKDKDSFATLDDDEHSGSGESGKGSFHTQEDGNEPTVRKSGSFSKALSRRSSKKKSKDGLNGSSAPASTTGTPRIQILKPPSLARKVVRALHDFSGSSADELSFKAGDEIIVVSEVLDDWWEGEMVKQPSKKGLFPTSYVEEVTASDASRRNRDADAESDRARDSYILSDPDDDEELRMPPMPANRSPSFYNGFDDAVSFTGSLDDDGPSTAKPIGLGSGLKTQPFSAFGDAPFTLVNPTKNDGWMHDFNTNNEPLPLPAPPVLGTRRRTGPLNPEDPAQRHLLSRSQSEGVTPAPDIDVIATSTSQGSPTKKIPPPPPPRRTHSHNPSSSLSGIPTPPIPERRYGPGASLSTPSGLGSVPSLTRASSLSSTSESNDHHGMDRSPFESAVDLEVEFGQENGKTVGCGQFRQNPFKPRGMCSNCLEYHD
ncbi:hypothetical protein CVT24_008727 [Panaeolus cyanescens]|uniref:SH3 domain-containing protein n=1 Tax=Panaeolus cyanescens TaxID=181874 RepID=A0A409VB07_9AGAR|nr:hypothetical protein CVT24_008727 [Panaeolus cyanescens]